MVEVVSPLASGYFWERSIYSFQPSITSFSFLGYQLSSIFHEGCRVLLKQIFKWKSHIHLSPVILFKSGNFAAPATASSKL